MNTYFLSFSIVLSNKFWHVALASFSISMSNPTSFCESKHIVKMLWKYLHSSSNDISFSSSASSSTMKSTLTLSPMLPEHNSVTPIKISSTSTIPFWFQSNSLKILFMESLMVFKMFRDSVYCIISFVAGWELSKVYKF